MTDYSHTLVKSYRFWDVHVAENQSYLGRCTVWCKREDATDLTEATPEEQVELFAVLAQLREVATKLFGADWFNYSFLGNQVRHLHAHFLPRYGAPVDYAGMKFTDEHYGWHYQTDHDFQTPPDVLEAVVRAYRQALNQQ